ncbi:unnamed protein product [Ostreobium quekettii]|uniref:Uncharacterized protein n=1 Tax=Ostreobium quekettii TaxID=121088 RepID=A0A8S1JB03_9CHLO|nr:unnamed protein product [Ostreobium quekettii]
MADVPFCLAVWIQSSRVPCPVDDRAGNAGASLKIEEDWLVPQLQGEDIQFTSEEIEQTVQEITGIATGSVKVFSDSDSVDLDATDHDIDAVIDQANIVPAGQGMQQLAKMTNIMLNRPSIQHEILQALQQEPELRDMIESMATRQGDTAFLAFGVQRPALLGTDPCVEDVTDGDKKNLLQALMHDIAHGLEVAGEGVTAAGQRVGNFLGRLGRWLRGAGDAATRDNTSNGEKVIGLTLCFAAIVMAVLVAKRVGFIRVVSRH